MALSRVNAVVVGSGAGGGVVAKELAEAGLSVVLLERGKWYTAYDGRKDDLLCQYGALGNVVGPDDERYRRVFVNRLGEERVVLPSEAGYTNVAACVGGGTKVYGAMGWRYMEKDFRMRSTYGVVEGSTLDDWPISYQDMEPFYTKAEWEIGVSGDDTNNPFKAPRSKPLPMPPLPPSHEHMIMQAAAERLKLHPFHIPMLRNTVPYNGRAACMRCRWCCCYICEQDAKCGTQNTVIPRALATGNCSLRTECVAKEVLTNDQGKVTGVAYFDENGRLQEQPADLVVLSASATESARLLLNSKNRLFPTGLGNRHDWVGRNLVSHLYWGVYGLMEYDTYDDLGPGASIAVCDYNHGNPGFVGGGLLANEFIRHPINLALSAAPPNGPRWGGDHKAFMRTFFNRSIATKGPVHEMPMWDCRVQVEPRLKDAWGIPVLRVTIKRHPNDFIAAKFLMDKAAAWLKEAGAVATVPAPLDVDGIDGSHQAGTCRMGNDSKTSVVDRYCRVHDFSNLFIADAGVHPNNGGFNPVLTIMANAYRVSDHIVQTWKGTEMRG